MGRTQGTAAPAGVGGLKRAFDLVVAILALVLLALPLLFVALLVALFLGRPVLFRQQRPGLGGKPFWLYKFRTMTDARDAQGRLLPDEQRLTRLGRFLRRTSIDELPELINVIKGEMSLVGPRPLLMSYLDRYTPEQARRHEVRPGITGWAQVNGRNAISWEEKFELDVWYVDHASLALDVKILAMTVWKTLRREGISAAGHATMPEFLGSKQSSAAGDGFQQPSAAHDRAQQLIAADDDSVGQAGPQCGESSSSDNGRTSTETRL